MLIFLHSSFPVPCWVCQTNNLSIFSLAIGLCDLNAIEVQGRVVLIEAHVFVKNIRQEGLRLIYLNGYSGVGGHLQFTLQIHLRSISHAFQNLPTPYAEWSVAPLNGEQLRPLVCFVPLCGPLSEQRCIIQCFLHWEFSWGRSCFCCQLLFWIQKTIPRVHIHIFN